jgi:guanosine-3',5'-bis(diphosphate) 3'-pyrophosphohydrolase
LKKESFLEKIKQINPTLNLDIISKAFDYTQKIYGEQKRLSGQLLTDHCAEIALDLAEINLGSSIIAAALLHEVLEKFNIPREGLKKEMGEEVTFLVEGVTNLGKVEHRGAQRSLENLKKLFLATAKDIRVLMIKLVNRYHGMKTLWVFPPEKQKRLAQETLEVYAPIAYRLGMRKVSGELEDVAFPILWPEKYEWLLAKVKDKYQTREHYLKKLTPVIEKELKKAGIEPIEIHSRAKRYFSLYRKLNRYQMDLNKIYDLVALRIVVKDVDDCYAALGVIHKLWKPLPGRIKDYIALPKPNGYRSLHTTVFCPGGKITEFQIRTPEMHREAEYGIASHWYYSEKKGLRDYIRRLFTKPPEKELRLMQQLQQWQKEGTNEAADFFDSLKIDFFKNRIFVFTPLGDVVDLPEGATPVDFAYHIHSEIGSHCQGAKVDGKMVALDTPLQNGQMIEIITQKQAHPTQDWLRFAKTNQAQNRIKAWLNKYQLDFAAALKEIKKEPPKTEPPKQSAKLKTIKPIIEVAGDEKIATILARCCKPQPPDEIIGYITISHRITVHRKDCHNLKRLKDQSRLVEVGWKK